MGGGDWDEGIEGGGGGGDGEEEEEEEGELAEELLPELLSVSSSEVSLVSSGVVGGMGGIGDCVEEIVVRGRRVADVCFAGSDKPVALLLRVRRMGGVELALE